MSRTRGFTLTEVLIVVCLVMLVTGTMAAVVQDVHGREELSEAYARDVADLRRAVRTLRKDLRETSDWKDVRYRLVGDGLRRKNVVIARNIGAFRLVREGRMAHVRIQLGPRSDAPARREAVLEFRVHLRTLKEGS